MHDTIYVVMVVRRRVLLRKELSVVLEEKFSVVLEEEVSVTEDA